MGLFCFSLPFTSGVMAVGPSFISGEGREGRWRSGRMWTNALMARTLFGKRCQFRENMLFLCCVRIFPRSRADMINSLRALLRGQRFPTRCCKAHGTFFFAAHRAFGTPRTGLGVVVCKWPSSPLSREVTLHSMNIACYVWTYDASLACPRLPGRDPIMAVLGMHETVP